jgi:leader peptidase (prepilin peptidase)/N-methyltransferase
VLLSSLRAYGFAWWQPLLSGSMNGFLEGAVQIASPSVTTVGLLIVAPFVGSFLGLLIKRLPTGRRIALARSECEFCHHPLGPRDLVPFCSWISAGGRCRYCGQAIGIFYPGVELAALLIAAWAALMLPDWIAWAGAGFGWALLTLAWIDQETYQLPNVITLPLAAAGLAVTWLIDRSILVDHLLGAAAGFAFLSLVGWAYRSLRGRPGLGGGDAKLLGAVGGWVAWQGLPTVVLYAAVSGLAVALLLVACGRRLQLSERIPFGPHLCVGAWLVWLYGPLVPAW